jgi:hypothetical protein
MLLSLILLASCGQLEWTIPLGKTQVDFQRESYECERDARYAFPGGPATVGANMDMQNMYLRCMHVRGYDLVKKQ